MANTNIYKHLDSIFACHKAKEWIHTQTNPQRAWDTCPNGSWLMWLLVRTSAGQVFSQERKKLFLCALECVQLLRVILGNDFAKRMERISSTIAKCNDEESMKKALRLIKPKLCRNLDTFKNEDIPETLEMLLSNNRPYLYLTYTVVTSTVHLIAKNLYDSRPVQYGSEYTYREDMCADIIRAHYPKPPLVKDIVAFKKKLVN